MSHIPVPLTLSEALSVSLSAVGGELLECRGGPWDGDWFVSRGGGPVVLESGSYWRAQRRMDSGVIVAEMQWL